MNSKPLKTTYELSNMIVEGAMTRHGRWPAGMTVFVFDDAYGWSASISRSDSDADDAYRTGILDLVGDLVTQFDLKATRLSGRGV